MCEMDIPAWSAISCNLTTLDKETGKGKTGPAWAVGAQAVEVEYDTKEHTYRLIKAVTVIDAGKVLNPKTARGVITGGMCMGLGLGTREEFLYDAEARVQTTSLRTYKVMHIGQEPKYIVEFIETPHEEGPFGARGISEHGIIGIPAALANALSSAAEVDLNLLPITPETIWMAKTGGAV
jgi:CO/xanthine dehydrogenase Mo-binding subunit